MLVGLATLATGLSLVLGAVPATASPVSARSERAVAGSASSSSLTPSEAASGCAVYRFNYLGYMACDSSPCDLKINGTVVESWVVADSRRIWHAWQGSGGWKEMPNGGRADDTWKCYINGRGQRQIEVAVYPLSGGFGSVWYSARDSAGTWWGWYRYPGT